MSVYHESGFKFDFTKASGGSVVHDKAPPGDSNTIWAGVDFRVFEVTHEVWIEVKSWSFKLIKDKAERHKAKRDFVLKAGAEEFRDDIVSKFLGTTAYLFWSGIGGPGNVLYVVFLEPPDRGSRALLQPFRDRLRDEFKNAQARPWGGRIDYFVVDLDGFKAKLANYEVERV